ncbi:hypothetical protein HRbin37_02434 [bacterium HR37]|nr:hypothetical protein HRbin37_02434 [bacterium HR37]
MDEERREITNLRLSSIEDLKLLQGVLKGWENKLVKKMRVFPNGIVKEEGLYYMGSTVLVEAGSDKDSFLQVWVSNGVVNIRIGDFVERAGSSRIVIQRYWKDPWSIYKDVFRVLEDYV